MARVSAWLRVAENATGLLTQYHLRTASSAPCEQRLRNVDTESEARRNLGPRLHAPHLPGVRGNTQPSRAGFRDLIFQFISSTGIGIAQQCDSGIGGKTRIEVSRPANQGALRQAGTT